MKQLRKDKHKNSLFTPRDEELRQMKATFKEQRDSRKTKTREHSDDEAQGPPRRYSRKSLTIAGGSLFGFVPGLIFGLIGENASAQTAYLLARFFRTDVTGDGDSDKSPRIAAFSRLLREQAFPTVLVLRASFLPFDLVNYACGLLRVPWLSYTFGSIIGMLPPMITFVSFGATVNLPELLKQRTFSPEQLIDGSQLAISGGLLVASAIIAYFAHRRRKALADSRQDSGDTRKNHA